jgi:hypothetical protein
MAAGRRRAARGPSQRKRGDAAALQACTVAAQQAGSRATAPPTCPTPREPNPNPNPSRYLVARGGGGGAGTFGGSNVCNRPYTDAHLLVTLSTAQKEIRETVAVWGRERPAKFVNVALCDERRTAGHCALTVSSSALLSCFSSHFIRLCLSPPSHKAG